MWSNKSAGGNHALRTFMNNPQYRVKILPQVAQPNLLAEVHILCETKMAPSSINVRMFRGGERITESASSQILSFSYRRGRTHGIPHPYHVASMRTRLFRETLNTHTEHRNARRED